MKTNVSPFFLRRLECPICKTINEFETLKMGAYTEEGRDTDFRPTGCRWVNPKYADVNPLLYFMATCTSCFYTRELTREYREWKNDTTFRTYRQKAIRQRHLSALAVPEGLVRRLGTSLWQDSYPTQTAINKLLLGILDEQMLEQPSDFDLGRWYLRVGWLFRDLHDGGVITRSPRDHARRRLFSVLNELRTDLTKLGQRTGTVREVVETEPQSATRAPDDENGPAECLQKVDQLQEHLTGFAESLDALLGWLQHDQDEPFIGDMPSPDTESYGDFPSYTAFLKGLKADWTGVPLSEGEALQFSLDYYRRAYEEGHGLEPGNPQIQVTYMIGELARRVGSHQLATEYLNLAVRLGRDWIHQMGDDRTQTALARRIADLAIEQIRKVREEMSVPA